MAGHRQRALEHKPRCARAWGGFGASVLHRAARWGRGIAVPLLVSHPAALSCRAGAGSQPVHLGAGSSRCRIVLCRPHRSGDGICLLGIGSFCPLWMRNAELRCGTFPAVIWASSRRGETVSLRLCLSRKGRSRLGFPQESAISGSVQQPLSKALCV